LVELNILNTSESNLGIGPILQYHQLFSWKTLYHTTKKKATKNLIRFSISTIKLVSAVASLVEIPSCEIVTALSVLALLFEKLQSWHWHLFARAGDTLIV
jgi:hypothetical protein